MALVSQLWTFIRFGVAAVVGIALDLFLGECLLVGGLPERLVRIVCWRHSTATPGVRTHRDVSANCLLDRGEWCTLLSVYPSRVDGFWELPSGFRFSELGDNISFSLGKFSCNFCAFATSFGNQILSAREKPTQLDDLMRIPLRVVSFVLSLPWGPSVHAPHAPR